MKEEATMNDDEKKEVRKEFRNIVNMSLKELGDWLETEESKAAGWQHEDGGEAPGADDLPAHQRAKDEDR